MRRRRGITLIEVLVAIFIMAIGLLAILTLFPLGALRMAEALQDDRDAASASTGANVCDAFNLRNGPDPNYYNPNPTPPAVPVNYYLGLGFPAAWGLPQAAQNGSGYPVYIDPWGVSIGSGPVGNVIPRVVPSTIPGYTTASTPSVQQRYFTLLDDLTFFSNGAPDTSNGSIQRFGRYTWAYLLHRSQPASPTSSVDLTRRGLRRPLHVLAAARTPSRPRATPTTRTSRCPGRPGKRRRTSSAAAGSSTRPSTRIPSAAPSSASTACSTAWFP